MNTLYLNLGRAKLEKIWINQTCYQLINTIKELLQFHSGNLLDHECPLRCRK